MRDRPPCSVCGKPATTLVRDIKEAPPSAGFVCWEPDGDPVAYCEEHDVNPVYTMLDGTQRGGEKRDR